MKLILIAAIFHLLLLAVYVEAIKTGAVRLQDIEVLTFTKGEYTKSRRTSAVPQMKCVGGSAKGKYEPHTAMCKNIGFDGRDVAWKCQADLPSEYDLGKVRVSCEGFEYPEDSYVLQDSCALEYNLEFSESGRKQAHSSHHKDYQTQYVNERGFFSNIFHTITSWIWSFITLPFTIMQSVFHFIFKSGSFFMKSIIGVLAALVGVKLFRNFTQRQQQRPVVIQKSSKIYSTTQPVGVSGGGLAGGSGTEGSESSGPGFWSGVLGGGLAGYLLSRNKNNNTQPRQLPDGKWTTVPSNIPVPPPLPDEHESTAYGTTKRR